jgi:hypothetical protein
MMLPTTRRRRLGRFGRVAGRLAVGAALLAAATCAGPGAARADSIFSSVGFGQWQNAVDVRAAAMGDVSVVGAARFGFSPRNPSLAGYMDRPAGYASVTSDFTRVDAGAGIQTRPDATLPLLGVGVPLGAGIVASGHIHPLTDGRYEITQQIPGNPSYELEMTGEGGWTQLSLGLARRFGDVALGLQVGIPFTALDETASRTFGDDAFANRNERLETDLDDALFVMGGVHYTTGPIDAGAYIQLPTTGTVVIRREAGQVVTSDQFELGIPAAFGGGLGVRLPGGLRVAGEYRRQGWDSTEIDGESWRELPRSERTRGYKDQDAWGVGMEWQRPSREGLSSAPLWRAGYGFEPWVTAGPNFGRVTDRTLTAGVGIPFREGNGELGIALRYTFRRESNGDLEENVFGIVLGLAFARQPREF